MDMPKRKANRLIGYDYSQNGAYFITICSKNHEQLFSQIVGAVDNRPSYTELSVIGKVIEKEIQIMQEIRKNIVIDCYVIMPNHVHMIIVINNNGDNGRLTTAPTGATVSEIVRLWKRAISKQIGFSPWQKSFHDRIIAFPIDFAVSK